MNIQFMTKENNGVVVKDNWTNRDRINYQPNFDELIKNASCDEEKKMLEEAKARYMDEKVPMEFRSFAFEIVYTQYADHLDPWTHKWSKRWQLMQHPWYRLGEETKPSKEEMIAIIENELKK